MKAVRHIVEFLCWLWLFMSIPPDHPEQPHPSMNRKLQSFLDASWLKWLWTMKVEAVLLVLGIILFFAVIPWLRAVDPTAAGLDGGVLSFPAVGVLAVIVGIILYFIFVRAVLPYLDKWFDGDLMNEYSPEFRVSMEKDWRGAGPVARLAIFFGLMAVVVLGVCVVTAAAF